MISLKSILNLKFLHLRLNLFFTLIYDIEMLIKIIALGP
jgi:hypothetical protein